MSELVEKAETVTTVTTDSVIGASRFTEKHNVSKEESEKALGEVKGMLGQLMRILISDGRLVEGELQCMDSDLNFILGGAVEYYGLKDQPTIAEIPEDIISRKLGLAMIPGKHVVRVLLLRRNEVTAKEEV